MREHGFALGDWLAVSADAHPLLLLAAITAASSGFNVSLCTATTGFHPETKLLLHGDTETAPIGVAALPLGLAGAAHSLLSLLDSPLSGDVDLHALDSGMIEFGIPAGRARCRLADLVDGFESLSSQTEKQLWLLDGRSPFGDLIACLAGWSVTETVRVLAVPDAD